ncbi:hypothetical protein AAFF_G00126770 [Aldrovandia affinis]|uniref:Uncharacterized protein n=1 Tax=Aldrovandia affinis TaxID=143900 RepID=A0AAD7RR82_9TELE|nr:hypothetical protein AAFF_G00126770 [Aldrovandia affinis]
MYMAKTRQVVGEQAEADGESDGSTGDEVTVASAVQRVLIKQSPYLDAFHEHLPVRLTIDSGATGNMMKASCATQLGVTITGSTQSAHQADGSSLLKVLGEIRTHFQRDGHNLYFEGLVVEDLDSDILAGIPFMEKNDVSIRPAKHQICLGDDVYRYGTYHTSTDRHAVQRAHVLRAPAKSTVWPGEYIELDLPPDLCDVDGELAVEPHMMPCVTRRALTSGLPQPCYGVCQGRSVSLISLMCRSWSRKVTSCAVSAPRMSPQSVMLQC